MGLEIGSEATPNQAPDNRALYQKNWEELPQDYRDNLVEKYGEPITIEGAKFEITQSESAGTCPANEKSLAAIYEDRLYWGYYGMGIVNRSMLVYGLEMHPRIIASKVVKGSEGGFILPGMIYTESDYPNPEVDRLHLQMYQNGTTHTPPDGERGDFITYHLPEKGGNYRLTPLRGIEHCEVKTNSFSNFVDDRTVGQIIAKAEVEAQETRDDLYENLHRDMSVYFDSSENPELIKEIKLTKPLIVKGEINMTTELLRETKQEAIVANVGDSLQAIKDPVFWNKYGREAYIVNSEGKYYFCPPDIVEVIK